LALFVTAVCNSAAFACSQCECGSPTPPGFLLETSAGRFGYGIEDRYLSKENVLADAPGHEEQTEHRISGLVFYRPSSRLGMQVRLPYVFKKNIESAVGESQVTTHSDGIGDASVRTRLEVARFGQALSPPRTMALIADVTVPTGSDDHTDASGERLEAHLQPGTGSWAGMAGVAFDASLRGSALSASVLARFNGTNGDGYHYGNALLLNAGYARTLSPSWEAALELNGRSARRDKTEEGSNDPNSGGSLLYVAPSVRYSVSGLASIQFMLQIPVAQSLYGDQTERATARLGVVFSKV
jgi:hypothetical protein